MSENKQKHETSQYSTSKYARKHQQQNAGHFSENSPFQSSHEAKLERIKQAESQVKTAVPENQIEK